MLFSRGLKRNITKYQIQDQNTFVVRTIPKPGHTPASPGVRLAEVLSYLNTRGVEDPSSFEEMMKESIFCSYRFDKS